MVGVRAARVVPRHAAVVGLAQADVGIEDMLLVGRIDPQAAEPPLVAGVRVRAAADVQRVAVVVGVEEALVRPVRGARDDVDALRVTRRDRDADAAEVRVRGQARLLEVVGRQRIDDVLEPLPCRAAVVGAEQAGADPAVGARAVVALVIPQRGVDAVVVGRVDGDVDRAGRRVRRCEHLLPGRAGVVGDVEAALRGDARDRAGGRGPDRVRIGRVDDDAAERRSALQPHVLPADAAVGRLVDAVAEVGQAAAGRVRLAGPGPQRAVGPLGERAHRLRLVARPRRRVGHAGVGALPHAAA